MVLLHVKRSDKDTFLFDTPAATEVDVVLREVVAIHNLRQKIGRLAAQVEGLAAHGPMKVPEQQGLDDETPLLEDYDVKDGTTRTSAPTRRSGARGTRRRPSWRRCSPRRWRTRRRSPPSARCR